MALAAVLCLFADLRAQPRLRRGRHGDHRLPARPGARRGDRPRRRQHVGLLPAPARADQLVRQQRAGPAPALGASAPWSTVGAIAAIADRLFGRLAALYSGILCAVSPAARLLGPERARLRADGRRSSRSRTWPSCRWWTPRPGPSGPGAIPTAACGSSTCSRMTLATYASFVAVLVIAAQVVALLPRRRRRRLLPFSVALAALRGPVHAADRARAPAGLGPAVLGPGADPGGRAAGDRVADLRRPAAELP